MKRKDYASSYGVIGLGRFGMALVECLSSAGKEVIAIDKEESRVREARRFTEMALVVETWIKRRWKKQASETATSWWCVLEKESMSASLSP